MAFSITNTANVTDDGTLALLGATSVTTAVVSGTTYLFAAALNENAVSVFRATADGSLVHTGNVVDAGRFELEGVASVTTAEVGGVTYLFAGGFLDDGVSVFAVGADGSLNHVDAVDDGEAVALRLSGVSSVTTAVIGGTTYLFAAGRLDDGVSVFSVGAGGLLVNVENVTDDGGLDGTPALFAPHAVTAATVGSTTYLFAATAEGVAVFAVDADGSLTSVANIVDDGTLKLGGASSATTAVVAGTTYLFVAGSGDDGLSVFSVRGDGALINVWNVTDNAALELDGARSVTTAAVGGTTYLFVAGDADDGMSVFAVNADGSLTNIANVADAGALQLDGASSVTTAVVDGKTYLFAAGDNDSGVSVFLVENPLPPPPPPPGVTITGTKGKDIVDATTTVSGQPLPTDGNDVISGLSNKDRLSGLAGDDLIDGGKHKDNLFGGAGADTFVFSASLKEKPDTIGDFVAVDDTIQLLQKKFRKLELGALSDTAFRDIGEAATDEDRIIYKASGKLSYDKDGKGGADAIVFAKLAGAPDIAASDFLVV